MTTQTDTPRPSTGKLVTVAYLKAQLDEGSDHLGIFMPLILDVIAQLQLESFTTVDVQSSLGALHGIAMPQQAVATLLKRATTKRYVLRESGRFTRNPDKQLPPSKVASEKANIQQGQLRLAEALRAHAERRGIQNLSPDASLEMLMRFLEEEQVAMLLDGPPRTAEAKDTNLRQRLVIAEFVHDVVRTDPALLSVLRGMLDGLVLYQAAFLPNLDAATRRFKNLRVLFDSNLVRQALGYEGETMRTLVRETIDVLKAGGAQCIVLDKTVQEIRRILLAYEAHLGTAQGRNTLRPVPMARHFLTQRYSPSDVREMSALLEKEISSAGFQIVQAPKRIKEYTAGEKALTARLTDPQIKDELQPRVVHDVDCVAAVLTFRKSRRPFTIDDAVAVFATFSPLVIRNICAWWEEDEQETGLPPVVHIRALSNLAWLKKPLLNKDFKIVELVALCTAALRPSTITWDRFIRHLNSLQKSQRLNSDEVTSILVSAMSDQLLRDAEILEEDPTDIDAATLDEVVERVTASYSAKAEVERQRIVDEYERKLAELKEKESSAIAKAEQAQLTLAEETRRRVLSIEGRARRWARLLTISVQWIIRALVIAGAVALIIAHPLHGGWLDIVLGAAVVVFVFLELAGILKHLSNLRASTESRLTRTFRQWLEGEQKIESS